MMIQLSTVESDRVHPVVPDSVWDYEDFCLLALRLARSNDASDQIPLGLEERFRHFGTLEGACQKLLGFLRSA